MEQSFKPLEAKLCHCALWGVKGHGGEGPKGNRKSSGFMGNSGDKLDSFRVCE